jgi:hypothetical protein
MAIKRTLESERRLRLLQSIDMHGQGREMSENQERIIDEICQLLPSPGHSAMPLVDIVDAPTRQIITQKLTSWMTDEQPNACRSQEVVRILQGRWPQ